MKKILIFVLLGFSSVMLYSQGVLKGRVTDSETGEAVPGAAVYIHELQKGTVTDVDGFYVLNKIPRGRFQVHYSMIGYGVVHLELEIKGDEVVSKDIKLEPKALVTPEVTISAIGFGRQHNNAIKVDIIKIDALKTSVEPGPMQKLSAIPGVDIISRGSGVGTPVIRGLSLTNILGLNNNVRIENFQFSTDHPYLIDAFGVERVEVIKGPASILYGANAVGGVINFIREVPAPVGTVKGDVNLNYYGGANGFEGNVGVKGTRDKYFFGIRAGGQSFADYSQPDGSKVPNSRFNRKNVQLMTGFNAKNATFKIYYDFMNFRPSMVVPPAAKDNDVINDHRKQSDWFQNLNYNLISSRNTFFLKNNKLELNFSYQNNLRRLIANNSEAVNMFLQSTGYELKNTFSAGEKIVIIGGIQGHFNINRNGNAPNHVLPDYSGNEASVFAFGQYKPCKRVTLQTGLRYDNTTVDIAANQNINPDLDNGLKRSYGNVSFTAGATVNITKSLMLRANFANAFRPPSVAELTQWGLHGDRLEYGDPDLKTQRNYETDISLHYHIQKLVFDLAGFYNVVDNYIYLKDVSKEVNTTQYQVFAYRQSNAVLSGMETGFRYLISKPLEVNANYAYVTGVKKNGEYLPRIPQNKLKLNLFFKRALKLKKKMDIGGSTGVVYAFSKKNVSPEEVAADDYFVWNAAVNLNIPSGRDVISVSLFLNNILNSEYIDFLSMLRPQGYFEQGRNFGIKTTFRF